MGILQIPETMPKEHYAIGSVNLVLFIIFAISLITFGALFFLKAKTQEVESVKRLNIAFGLFGVLYGICRIFFILMFHIEPDKYYNLIANIAYAFGIAGFTAIIWALEKVKYKTNYFFLIGLTITLTTIVGIFLFLAGLTQVREIILFIIAIGTPIAGFFIVILYIQMIKLSTGSVRKKALLSLIGFLILVAGITMDGQYFLAIEAVPLWFKNDLVPIICIVGYLIFAVNQYRN